MDGARIGLTISDVPDVGSAHGISDSLFSPTGVG